MAEFAANIVVAQVILELGFRLLEKNIVKTSLVRVELNLSDFVMFLW